jgi:hypothetical protein
VALEREGERERGREGESICVAVGIEHMPFGRSGTMDRGMEGWRVWIEGWREEYKER